MEKDPSETHLQNTVLFIRFCTSCSAKQKSSAKFCWRCGSPVQCGLPAEEPSTSQGPKLSFGKPVLNQPKSKTVKTFEDFMTSKKKEQQAGSNFRPRKKAKVSPDENVTINVGLMRVAGNDLKPVWGKRLPIQVPKTAGYARVLSKGIDKWAAFDRKFDPEEDYFVLYEDGSHALSLPGQEDDFELEKYKNELGKDYRRITMYLCTAADYEMSEGTDITESDISDFKPTTAIGISLPLESQSSGSSLEKNTGNSPPFSCDAPDGQQVGDLTTSVNLSQEQILEDASLAKVLQEWEKNSDFFGDIPDCPPKVLTEPSQVVKLLAERVDQEQDFFLVSRRAAPFTRTLALWQRQTKKTPPRLELIQVPCHRNS